MNHLCVVFFFFLCVSLHGLAQNDTLRKQGRLQGYVEDARNKDAIAYATIRILNASDSLYVQGGITDTRGKFGLNIPLGKYIVEISCIGYRTQYVPLNISVQDSEPILKRILLEENTIMLKEAVVEAKVPDIVVRGDTIEYNASAYRSEISDVLQDIIKKIPGIEIDGSGNISANGKPVKKILVDGKEFFDNDISLALSNLPANMIRKLQLFKEESDNAKITGFKDKDPDQVLNVVVEDELKQSIFGNGRAGYGSDEKYEIKAMTNYLRNNDQFSFVGDVSNVNTSEYGVISSGIDKNKNIGVNLYKSTTNKFKIGGNVRYTSNDNQLENKSSVQTFLPTGDRFSEQNSISKNKREGVNTGLNLSWEIDSLTTVYYHSYLNVNKVSNGQYSSDISYVTEKDTTDRYSTNLIKGDGFNINNNVTIGRRLNSKGRTVSLGLGQVYRKDKNSGSNYSETKYTDNMSPKIIDQRTKTDSHSTMWNLNLSYVEPIGKDNSLQFSYSYATNVSERFRDTRKKDEKGEYTIIDTAYARVIKNDYTNQSLSLRFQSRKEKYNYMIGFSADPTSTHSRISIGDSIIEDLKQRVANYSPSFYFSYTPNSNTNLDINYSGSTSQPSVNQLSMDTIIVNALSKYYGNPNLKPSYNNNLSVFYQKSNFELNRFLLLTANFAYTFNNIVSYTEIDDQGNSLSSYRNVDGNMGGSLGAMYNTPLRNKKYAISSSSYVNYNRNVGYMNSKKTITDNVVLTEQLMFKYIANRLEASIDANISHNITRNNLSNAENRNTTNYGLTNSLLLKLPWGISLQSNLSYSRFTGYEAGFKKSECLWNASVNKIFLKDKKGTLKFHFFDIFNDRNNLTRNVNSISISDTRTNTISRYFMLSFAYRFNIFKGGQSQSNDNEYFQLDE